MNFRALFLAAALACAPLAASTEVDAAPGQTVTPNSTGSYQVAQACGWYAISRCSRGRRGARRGVARHGGYVIDTSSDAYPNFRPGWYCAVVGPTSRRRAQRRVRDMRYEGARSAYIKSGC